ncbi:hypothetical protein BDZ91DRAFT_766686 [Kalaharituber pfeilii]|nr:hypothetical protein BDZ91DRAFT_766686 [Kalaharituber pfeilii]
MSLNGRNNASHIEVAPVTGFSASYDTSTVYASAAFLLCLFRIRSRSFSRYELTSTSLAGYISLEQSDRKDKELACFHGLQVGGQWKEEFLELFESTYEGGSIGYVFADRFWKDDGEEDRGRSVIGMESETMNCKAGIAYHGHMRITGVMFERQEQSVYTSERIYGGCIAAGNIELEVTGVGKRLEDL